jgi:DNA polymerase-1
MRVLLVDGTNIVMRYAHAMLPDVVAGSVRGASEEDVTRVLTGVERAIREAAALVKATHAIIATDSSVDPWRKALFPEYKAHRKGITSIWSNRLFLYLAPRGWLCLRAPGEEADDVLATLAVRLGLRGAPAVVLSGDSDLLALMGDACHVMQFGNKAKGEEKFVLRTPAYVVARFGVVPSRLHLYKALVGEPGDNLPGVHRVGDKKARKLLDLVMYDERGGHDSLRRLLADHSPSAVDEFNLALQLATLNTNVALDPIQPARCAIPGEP